MYGRGKSDSPIVPGKPPNKVEAPAAEAVEGRGLAKGNLREQNTPRTLRRKTGSLSRSHGRAIEALPEETGSQRIGPTYRADAAAPSVPSALERVRKAARKDRKQRFTALMQRCSQKYRLPWQRVTAYIDRWLPPARICHPYPLTRLAVTTQGRSRMR